MPVIVRIIFCFCFYKIKYGRLTHNFGAFLMKKKKSPALVRQVIIANSRLIRYRIQRYNLGQIKWKFETTPPPQISDGKMAFWPSRGFILDLGGRGHFCIILFCPRLSLLGVTSSIYGVITTRKLLSYAQKLDHPRAHLPFKT